jgi:two-component system nitrate/nitrite response regulator NarL
MGVDGEHVEPEQWICRTEPAWSWSIMKVVICDHHRLFADAFASIVDARTWTIVGTPVDPAHAVAVVAQTRVDVCLMDLAFADGMTGIAAIHEVSPATKVVALTASSDPALIMRAVQSGADGIVFKDDDIDRIIDVSEQAVYGTTKRNDTRARSIFRADRRTTLARAIGTSYASARIRIRHLRTKLARRSELEPPLDHARPAES